MRALLLIPGRGKNSPDGVAVLRERVQAWLTQDPLKRVVLAFCTARPVDGGPGSLYVLLRKYRKKGKVLWERCPVDLDF
jgi:DNA-nicking Smr family endonuclease